MVVEKHPDSINYVDELQSTPLGNAFFIQRMDIVQYLLSVGADPNMGRHYAESARHWNNLQQKE